LAGGAIGEPTYLRVRVSHDGALPSAVNEPAGMATPGKAGSLWACTVWASTSGG
jgi:hypothetical protein